MDDDTRVIEAGSHAEGVAKERLALNQKLAYLQAEAMERTAVRRMRSSLIATATVALLSVLAAVGVIFGLRSTPAEVAVPIAVTVGVIDALMAFAVGYTHRTTMKALQSDLQSAFGSRDGPRDGVREAAEHSEATPPPQASTQPVVLERSKSRVSFFGGLGAVVVAASVTATIWWPHATHSWAPFVAASIVAFTLVMLVVGLIVPAVWSHSEGRRTSALHVLYALLGLTVRDAPRRSSKSRSKMP